MSLAFCCGSLASLSCDKDAGLGPTVAEVRAGGNNDSRMITDTHGEVCLLTNPTLNSICSVGRKDNRRKNNSFIYRPFISSVVSDIEVFMF